MNAWLTLTDEEYDINIVWFDNLPVALQPVVLNTPVSSQVLDDNQKAEIEEHINNLKITIDRILGQ